MESQYNNVDTTLDIAGSWNGEAELCNGYVIILVYIKSSKRCTLKVRQSDNKSNYNFIETVEYLPITGEARYQIYRSSLYCYVEVINDSGEVIPDLIVRTHFLNIGRDSSIYYPTVIAGVVDVGNFPATQAVSGTVGVNNFPATQAVSGSVSIANDVTVKGVNSDFQFYATPTTNTQTIYSDGIKGTDVVGGWRYTNTATSKINWYCYSSSGSPTDYKVSQLSNMYAVVNNLSVLGLSQAQNPFIIFYTRPTGSGDASWYKSKYFFGSNAFTDILGVKLLYTGDDPITLHPEITGTNRIKLDFKIDESSKPLADGANESIWLGSLQTTNNTATLGSFNFDFQEFGVVWEKTPAILPIEFGKVQVSGDVSNMANRRQSLQVTTIGLSGSFTGTTFDLGENTVFDCLLLASGTITNGNVRIEYSLDGTTWIPDAGITITSTDPHAVVKGVKTSCRYIRVVKIASSLFQGTLSIYLSSCRI